MTNGQTSETRSGIAGVVLAAGAGARFGGPKQLAPLWGRPLLEHALEAMSRVPLQRTVVVLGAARDEIIAAVPLHGADPVLCDDWDEGQAAALRAGVAACADADAVVVTLGDQPLISSEAIERVVAARRGDVAALRATYGGKPGHPVLLEQQLFARVWELRGDSGARDLLAEVETAEVRCDGLGNAVDVDTPQQLAELEDVRR